MRPRASWPPSSASSQYGAKCCRDERRASSRAISSAENAPASPFGRCAAIQPITYLIPLRYYLVIVRGIFLKGVGVETFWPEAIELFAFGLGILTLAALRARKRAS